LNIFAEIKLCLIHYYAGYSVSQSKVEIVKRYIERQKEHHKKISFRDEYLSFLREYGVGFDEKYLWA